MSARETLSHPSVIVVHMPPDLPQQQQRIGLPASSGNPVTPLGHHSGVHSQATNTSRQETPANTFYRTSPRPAAEVEAYVRRLLAAAHRILKSQGILRHPFDNDDIVNIVAERFYADQGDPMARYQPEAYARASVPHACIEFDRKNRVQRSEGVRLEQVVEADGSIHFRKRRTYLSGSSPLLEGDGELFDTVHASGPSMEDNVADADDARWLLSKCLSVLSDRERDWLMQVDGMGIDVVEVADSVNLRRETVSRVVNGARKKVQAQRVKVFGDQGRPVW